MDKTKSKLAAFFDNDDEETSFLQKPVDDAKLSQYTSGKVRKSRREKEQEAADAKRREEEAEAAQAYADFLDAFEGEDVSKRKTGSGFVRADTKMSYAPSMPAADRRAAPRSLSPASTEQAEREVKYARHGHGHGRSVTAMAAYDGQSGSKDRGDPQVSYSSYVIWASVANCRVFPKTTNLFVANLPQHVTEPILGKFFAKIGPVGSVKIMWPRSDATVGPGADMTASRRAKNSGLNGFVSFMTRRDAEDALREYDGYDWGGSILRVGWSKAVPIAAKALYVSTTTKAAKSHMAAEVKGHDMKYEETLKDLEKNNPKYNFLLRRNHRRHAYYRGLVESEEPFKPAFDDEGYNSVYSTESEEESEKEQTRKTALGVLARRRFEAMLRALTGKRGEIARCMTFSLEHAEAAHEVADIIVSSLLVDGTAVPRKVARLHLICDILNNSAAPVPSAWKYRQEFQARLGIVFDHLANIYHSFPGRITADVFKKQITTVVDVWEDWIVFPPDFTSELRTRLEGAQVPSQVESQAEVVAAPAATNTFASKFKTSTFQLAKDATVSQSVASTPGNASDGEPMEVSSDEGEDDNDNVDGEPVEDVLDGEPIDVDGEPVDDSAGAAVGDDLDGEPIVDDVDGIPMDDDVDGEPIDVPT
ncbi:unnamed protein product [Cyclocybe aegerita]|uniref:U2 snRNP-associated SURP motif-containing protein n=1 Tax=Cyclocybe aegerita TaxID=1973307 RepID=A0A8S0VXZ9_CYCAE|nr:unnamed protein product [Cyclocybe aegerita]